MNNLNEIIKNNMKLYVLLIMIILVGILSTTYALIISSFKTIGINTTTMDIEANISYDTNSNGAEIVSNGNMLPISDDLVSVDVTDTRVLKAKFIVSGVEDNPDNTIYDIVLRDINIDCELRTEDLKWRLYKDNALLSEGSLSPTFDTMNNNRLVLTNTQEDLTTDSSEYVFLLWISEACTGDITECDSSMDQSKYLNRSLSANIKLELSTKSKKTLERITSTESSCNYDDVDIPLCNTLTYNGSSQNLVNSSTYYTLVNNSGVNAGKYAVTLELNDGYKWSDGSTDSKVINCNINKKDVTVTTLDQESDYLGSVSSNVSGVTASGLINGDKIDSVSLSTDVSTIGDTTININNVKIVDTNGNDVTYNYNIIKDNSGVMTYTSVLGTFYYYDGSGVASATSVCGIYEGKTTCNFDIPEEVLYSSGPDGSRYYGVSSSSSSSTITTTYNSVNTNYYAVYTGKLRASYTKANSGVASIGKTTDSCDVYKYYNGSSYTSTSCNITLPDITPASGYVIDGWYNLSGTKVGEPSNSVVLTGNVTFVAKVKGLTSSDFSYDNSKTGVDCDDVTCMLDYLYSGLE